MMIVGGEVEDGHKGEKKKGAVNKGWSADEQGKKRKKKKKQANSRPYLCLFFLLMSTTRAGRALVKDGIA